MFNYFIGIFILIKLIDLCSGGICHQDEISDGLQALQYELEMIQEAAEECLAQKQLLTTEHNGTFCDQVFDGIMCWPVTKAGSTCIQPCPSYMYDVLPNANATKTCMPDGGWYIHPEFNTTWTNLSGCYDPTRTSGTSILVPAIIETHLRYIKILYDVGYSISLVALLVAVTIMLYLRKLRCQRNTIHINMFMSFICRSIICFIKDIYVIPEVNQVYDADKNRGVPPFEQSRGCKVVYAVFYYILSTNFMWIFVEGIYMHTFVQSTKYNISTKLYRTLLIFGWGAPSTFVIPWIIVRIEYENTLCWSTHDVDHGYHWIIKGPITVTVVINFLFFVNIIRLLYTKLTASYHGNSNKYRKLTKSTLILIPLFGVHYIAYVALPMCMKPVLELIWMYTEMFFNSFQGFAVAVLFCFMNDEVRKELLKIKRKHRLKRNSHVSNRSRSVSGFIYHSDHDNNITEHIKTTSLNIELGKRARDLRNLTNTGLDRTSANGVHVAEVQPML